jgi:Na+-transporting NADH:ubiquinone oxidoreductase subunit NqrC
MKKTLFFCALVAFCVMFLASCVVVRKTETAKTRDVQGTGVYHIPTVATLDVSPTKVTELFTLRAKKKFIEMATGDNSKSSMSLAQIKTLGASQAHAVAKLLNKHNADILVEPRYSFEVTSTNSRDTYNIIVSGYPATYKNFRPATPADSSVLKLDPLINSPVRLIGTLITE